MKNVLIILVLLDFSTAHAAENAWYLYKYGEWSPGAEELSDIKKNIKAFVESSEKSQILHFGEWGEYLFQYFGIVQGGEKVIEIHAFCTLDEPGRLAKELVVILDGGSCYFQLIYHPDSKRFSNLQINGEA